MTSLKTSIKTITYLSDIGCLEIQGASLGGVSHAITNFLFNGQHFTLHLLFLDAIGVLRPITHFVNHPCESEYSDIWLLIYDSCFM
ncbi:hypothetical protein ESCOCK425M_19725 [Escherichia coli]